MPSEAAASSTQAKLVAGTTNRICARSFMVRTEMRGFVVNTALLNRITDPDARRRLQEAMVAEPRPESPPVTRPPQVDPLDRYRVPRKIAGWRRITAGCAGCRRTEPRGLQRQIETPERFKRLPLWFTGLPSSAARLWTALTGGFVDREAYDKRQTACDSCPDRVIHLRVVKRGMCETSYCGACDCPKWLLSRISDRIWDEAEQRYVESAWWKAIKNRLRGWRCPKRRHAGSDPDAVYRVYVLAQLSEERRAATGGVVGNNPTELEPNSDGLLKDF